MTFITIPKTEYQQLKRQALTLRRFYVKIFQSALRDPIDEVMADFEKTDLYTPEFLRDLEQGLRQSSYAKRASV